MAAAAHKVDNLCAIVDRNNVQATDVIANVLPYEHLAEKWAAFGWNVIEIDGHDMGQILEALDASRACAGKPTVIIANTVKGKGFPFAEGKAAFHNAALNDEQYALCLELVEQMKKEA